MILALAHSLLKSYFDCLNKRARAFEALNNGRIRVMDEQEVQKSCWGVAVWGVLVFVGVFAVFSLFVDHKSDSDTVASVGQEQPEQ